MCLELLRGGLVAVFRALEILAFREVERGAFPAVASPVAVDHPACRVVALRGGPALADQFPVPLPAWECQELRRCPVVGSAAVYPGEGPSAVESPEGGFPAVAFRVVALAEFRVAERQGEGPVAGSPCDPRREPRIPGGARSPRSQGVVPVAELATLRPEEFPVAVPSREVASPVEESPVEESPVEESPAAAYRGVEFPAVEFPAVECRAVECRVVGFPAGPRLVGERSRLAE